MPAFSLSSHVISSLSINGLSPRQVALTSIASRSLSLVSPPSLSPFPPVLPPLVDLLTLVGVCCLPSAACLPTCLPASMNVCRQPGYPSAHMGPGGGYSQSSSYGAPEYHPHQVPRNMHGGGSVGYPHHPSHNPNPNYPGGLVRNQRLMRYVQYLLSTKNGGRGRPRPLYGNSSSHDIVQGFVGCSVCVIRGLPTRKTDRSRWHDPNLH